MTKKIYRAILMVSTITLLIAISLFAYVLYNYFTDIQKDNQSEYLELVALGVSNMGYEYLENLETDKYRITWIAKDGVVLYDTKADASLMENHIDRKEVIDAIETGYGESKRSSKTLAEVTLYNAKLLANNSIIRVSFTQLTIISLLSNMLWMFIIVLVLAFIFSSYLANKTAKKAIEPLNNLDLDNPLKNDVYEEINPLLHRIDKQNKNIIKQIDDIKSKKNEISFIIDNVVCGIVMFNHKGYVLLSNKVANTLLGCNKDDYYLGYYRDVKYEKLIENAIDGIIGTTKLNINNEVFLFSASPTKISNDENLVFLFIHNITKEEKALELRRQFSANVSHELKTPLTTIMGSSELLMNDLVNKNDITSFGKNIYDESKRLLTLVQDIIKISRLDEADNFKFEVINLKDITKEVLERLKNKLNEKNIKIHLNLNNLNIEANKVTIYEMLSNLCDNAINYNKDNGEIFIDIKKELNTIIWQITDTGQGIKSEDLPYVFERFYRVDKSHSKLTGGTGLGLSIVKNGANLHNAIIDIESKVNVGTKITIKFNNKANQV